LSVGVLIPVGESLLSLKQKRRSEISRPSLRISV
jgi:hypothetical protein